MARTNAIVTEEQLAANPAAKLVHDAVRERQITHGRHAADLLAEHGHTEAADRVRSEVRAQHGHLSAKQALAFLLRTAEQQEA